MNGEPLLTRAAISGSFLSVFWGLWLVRISQVALASAELRDWAQNLNVDATKWGFTVLLLASVLFVVGLLWVFAALSSQRRAIRLLSAGGQPVPGDVILRIDRNWKLTLLTLLAISALVVALPLVGLAFFDTLSKWEVAMGSAVMPLVLGLLLIWPDS